MKQLKFNQTVSTFLVMSACFFALPGCQRQEGPMEQAGKEVDQAAENIVPPKAGPAEQVGQAMDNAAEKAGQHMQDAGEHMQDAAQGDKP